MTKLNNSYTKVSQKLSMGARFGKQRIQSGNGCVITLVQRLPCDEKAESGSRRLPRLVLVFNQTTNLPDKGLKIVEVMECHSGFFLQDGLYRFNSLKPFLATYFMKRGSVHILAPNPEYSKNPAIKRNGAA